MKRYQKNILFTILSLSILLFFCERVFSQSINITTYYPSITGSYEKFRLIPRSADLSNPCEYGTIYINSAGVLKYCNSSSQWGSSGDYWSQSNNDIYLAKAATDPTMFVGIGTTTTPMKLSLLNDGGILAKGTFANGAVLPNIPAASNSRLIWYPRKAAFRAGFVNNNSWDDDQIGLYSVALGYKNKASGNYSVAIGGESNVASGLYSTILGGDSNTASGDYSACVGANGSRADGTYATVSGYGNSVSGPYSTALGGAGIVIDSFYSAVGGGDSNRVLSLHFSNINGGGRNTINGSSNGYSVIGGGTMNTVNSSAWSSVNGGASNGVRNSDSSNIGGGSVNNIQQVDAVIKPFTSNILGGQGNLVGGIYSTISGGNGNRAYSDYNSIVNGGVGNVVGVQSFNNVSSGVSSVIAGGYYNTITAMDSINIGGQNNSIASDYSWAEGVYAKLSGSAQRTFLWRMNTYAGLPLEITAADSFIIATGWIGPSSSGSLIPYNPKTGIRDINPVGVLEINANSTSDDYLSIKRTSAGDIMVIKTNGYLGINKPTPTVSDHAMQFGNANNAHLTKGGVWTNGSSRETKNHIETLSSEKATKTLKQLSPVTYSYTKTPEKIDAGFIAEDVPELLAMNDRKKLSAMDIVAVLTKAAQDQQIKIERQNRIIEQLDNEIQKMSNLLNP